MDINSEIGPYRIVEHIGRGGMADVWSARDSRLNRLVAIKTIGRSMSPTVDAVGLFKHEARTIATLEHAHILPIYDFGEHAGRLYLVMRYVTGGALDARLAAGGLPPLDVLRLARATANALDYAHSRRVVHLDLKPQNILLDGLGTPYLADFGLAAMLNPEGRTQNPGSGTLLYMAPEQLTSDTIDRRADLYAFALVIYHLLVGKLPFNGDSPLALRQIQDPHALPLPSRAQPTLPQAVDAVLTRGTHTDPEARYATAEALVDELASALGAANAAMQLSAAAPASTPVASVASLDPASIQRREAEHLYQQARIAWAEGRGRFLLGVTHFMVLQSFYQQPQAYGLTRDEAGTQMLLRGAIEHNVDLGFWWEQLLPHSRRWVALHALRSESAPARVRALRALGDPALPDAQPPLIPQQIAQALQIEDDDNARLAALAALGARAIVATARVEGLTPDALHALTTQPDVQLSYQAPAVWREVAFTPAADALVAETALNVTVPPVAAAAARTVGRLRSTFAVQHLVEARRARRAGATHALALVRDEAGSLPPEAGTSVRVLAWALNTTRRLFEQPLALVWAFAFALLGGWLGMGQHVYRSLPGLALLSQTRLANTLAYGLFFGVWVGLLTLLALVLPRRLRGFWPWWARLAWSAVAGFVLGQFLWWVYVWFYLQNPTPPPALMVFAGGMTALGFVLGAMLPLPGLVGAGLTALSLWAMLWVTHHNHWRFISGVFENLDAPGPLLGLPADEAILYYREYWDVVALGVPLVLLVALGAYLPIILADVQRLRQARGQKGVFSMPGLPPLVRDPAATMPVAPLSMPVTAPPERAITPLESDAPSSHPYRDDR